MSSTRDRSRSRERTAAADKAHHSSSRSKHSRSRSRSRDRDRPSKKEHKKDRKRSRSRSRSADRKPHSSAHSSSDARRAARRAEKDQQRALEKQLKQAKKQIKRGQAASIDTALMETLIAAEKRKAEAKQSSSGGDRKKHSKRRDSPSSSESSSDSSSDDGEDPSASAAPSFLSDGVTPRLTKSDYFAKSTEFRVWLHESKGKHVDDIKSKRAKQLFAEEFVPAWNALKLAPSFYRPAGMTSTSVAAGSLTKHKWAIKMTDAERHAIESLKDDVDSRTQHTTFATEFAGTAAASASSARAAAAPAAAASSFTPADRLREKAEQKRYSAHQSAVLEELVPKATGRDALLEKRKERGAYAQRDKDIGGIEQISDADLMGGGGDYQAQLAKRKAAQSQHSDERAGKVSEYAAKEKDKMKKMLEGLGLAAKYPMQ